MNLNNIFTNSEDFKSVLDESITFRKLVAKTQFEDEVETTDKIRVPRKIAKELASLSKSDFVGAIKLLREKSATTLKDAKETIEKWRDGNFE